MCIKKSNKNGSSSATYLIRCDKVQALGSIHIISYFISKTFKLLSMTISTNVTKREDIISVRESRDLFCKSDVFMMKRKLLIRQTAPMGTIEQLIQNCFLSYFQNRTHLDLMDLEDETLCKNDCRSKQVNFLNRALCDRLEREAWIVIVSAREIIAFYCRRQFQMILKCFCRYLTQQGFHLSTKSK